MLWQMGTQESEGVIKRVADYVILSRFRDSLLVLYLCEDVVNGDPPAVGMP